MLEAWRLRMSVGIVLVVMGCSEPASPPGPFAPRTAATPTVSPAASVVTLLEAASLAQPGQPDVTVGRPERDDRMVWRWGRAGAGMPLRQREAGDFERVGELTNIVAVGAGLEHGLALRADGTIWSWPESTKTKAAPAERERVVEGLENVVAIAVGDHHNLALRGDGTVWAWGQNQHGQLGDGTNDARATPVPVIGLADVVAISAGSSHNVAVLADGTVRAWGLGALGRLGTGDNENRTVPIPVPGLEHISAASAGGRHSLAVGRDGTVWSWGYALLGDETEMGAVHTHPVQVVGVDNAIAVAAGWNHSLALTADGQVWAWGYNGFGELGDNWAQWVVVDNDLIDVARGEPRPVPGLDGVAAIAAGEHHSLALRSDGGLWAWGSNTFGELGSSRSRDPVFRATGAPVPTLHGVSAIAARGAHSLAVLEASARPLPAPRFLP